MTGRSRLGAFVAVSSIAALLAVALPLSAVVPAQVDQPPAEEATPAAENTEPGTFVGRVDATEVAVALVTNGDQLWAYACDGASTSAFFKGDLVGNSFLLTADNGAALTGAFQEGDAQGTFTNADGSITGAFTAKRPVQGGGLFTSEFNTAEGSRIALRWIVADDGTQRGNTETTTGGETAVTPAPPLPVEPAREQGTVPVDVAGGPVPVEELKPESLAGPVPTSTVPPPPPLPPNPPNQPVVVGAKVDPPKVELGTPVRYQLTLTNPNPAEVTGAGVGVGFPPVLTFQPATEKTTCKGQFVAFPPGATRPGEPQLVLSGVTLPPGGSCTADVAVVASAAAAVDVVTNPPTAQNAPPGAPAKATFVVGATAVTPGPTVTTTTLPPRTTTTTKPLATTTTRPPRTTTTTRPPATTTTSPQATTTTRPPATTTSTSTTTTTSPPRTTTTTAPRAGRTGVATAPSAPRNLRGRALSLRAEDSLVDGGRIELTFDPPASNGGTAIVDFVAQCRPTNAANPIISVTTRSSPVTLNGLPTRRTHLCTVAARNAAGTGAVGGIDVTVPGAERPGAPRNVRARALDLDSAAGPTGGRIEVTFDPPADDGGSAVVDSVVQCHPAFDVTITRVETGSSPARVTGLLAGTEYSCVVFARNGVGAGQAVPFDVEIPEQGVPSAPRNVRVRALPVGPTDGPNEGRAEISFDPPTDDGGAQIIDFTVDCVLPSGFGGGSPGPSADEPQSPITLSGFAIDAEYQCAISAFNLDAERGPVAAFRVKVPGPRPPSAPRNVEVRPLALRDGQPADQAQAEFRFDPPADNGGSRIVNFGVSCTVPASFGGGSPGPFNGGPSSPVTVTGFSVNVEYLCAVDAFNLAGTQSPAATVKVTVPGRSTPAGAPSAPRNVKARALPFDPLAGPTTGRVEVTFDPPADTGGSPIINFGVTCFSFPFGERSPGPSDGTRSSPVTLTGFEVDVDYQCAVEALYGAGAQSPEGISNFVTVQGPGKLSAPRNVRARALPFDPRQGPSGGRVEVTFDPPANTGGVPIVNFGVECFSFPFGERSPGPFNGEPSSPVTLTGFEVNVEYQCAVDAFNFDGTQSPEALSNFVIVRDPNALSAPRNVKARALPLGPTDGPKSGRVEVTFDPPARAGGAPLTDFFVFCTSQSDPDNVRDGTGPSSPRTVTGLDVDVAYVCSVTATNAAGGTGPLALSEPVTVRGPPQPSAPRNVKARALPLGSGDGPNDGRAELSFDPPARGAAEVAGYTVECFSFPFGEASEGPIADGVASPVTVVGLTVDVEYECSIVAFNRHVERGPAAAANPVTVVGARAPSPPRKVQARVLPTRPGDGTNDGRAEVSFDPPASNGGADITSFSVECVFFPFGEASPGPQASGPSPVTLSGFTVDTDYECSAFAVNRHGLVSAASEAATVKVPGATALVATPGSGSSPLPVTFELARAPKSVSRWELDFGDGTPKVRGEGAFRPVPHTFVNTTNQPATFNASLRVIPEDGDATVLVTQVPVHPAGTVLTLDGTPNPPTVRRGTQGTVNLVVGNPTAKPVPGPLSIFAVEPDGMVLSSSAGWDCELGVACPFDGGLEPFASAPPLSARFTVPADAPATFTATFQVIAGDGETLDASVRVPVVGVVANAGPDQTVDATTPTPDGSLAPTRVLLDGIESLGLEGDNQRFSWRQVGGQPRVDLDTKIDPNGRVVAFEAPPVAGETRLEFELTVNEGPNNSSTDRVVVTILPRNQPPVLSKIDTKGLSTSTRESGEIIPRGEGTLTLTADASDPDGDRLTTTWRVLTSGVPNGDAQGESFSLQWPVAGVAQVIVEATVADPRGAVDTATVVIGVAPDPLGLQVTAPARVAAGERVNAAATPSRRSGVRVEWTVASGTPPAGFPKTGRQVTFDAPDLSETDIVLFQVTATETATGATATRVVALEVQAGAPLSLSVPPAVAVDTGEAAAIEATVAGPSRATFRWAQTFGPPVQLRDETTRTVRFDAPDDATTIGLRIVASAGATTMSADTVVTVGAAGAAPTGGCGDGSAYQEFIDGGPVVLAGGLAVLSGFDAQGASDSCDEATLDGVDVILVNGLVVGDDLGGTVDEGGVRLTEGAVRLPDAFQLPDVDLGGSPLEIQFDGGGGGAGGAGGDPCISWDAAFSSAQFPFVPLPPGFSGAGGGITITCTSASITAEAAAGGATFGIDADLTSDGGADATATLTNVPVLGGTASGTGSITVAPGGAATYDLSATVTNPSLPIPGITLNSATARLTPAGLTVEAEGSLGQGAGSLAVSMDGSFAEQGLSLAVEATNNAPWEVGPGLTVEAANLVGTVDIDAAGAAIVDLRLAVGGDWRPVPGLRVTGLSLQVANTAVPPECAIPAGAMWVGVSGQGAIDIPGVAPVSLGVDACLGVPTGADAPPFSLRSTIGGAPWAIAPGVVIRDVAIEVNLVGGALTLEASGGATLLGLDLTARVLFLVPSGGGQPTVVVDAAGDLTGLGIPIPEAHVVFASAAVPDFEVAPGVTLDLPQGITGVGTIDLGQPIADLLNEAFSPPTPILPTVTVSISFGTTIEIKAAISLGGDGATLFMGCPGGGTSCDPTAPTTTRLALTSAFIRLVLGGSGGFSIGFGADGTLNLPPAEEGGPASPLDLHVEASIQPPARVGLAMFFEGAWQNAMGLSGLTMSNLGIQGSIDFSTTPVPLVTIGITGQVDRVPDPLAEVLGFTNNGEPQRFTVNVDPLAPILELTLGVADGGIVMRPLTAVGQADALEVDFTSVVIAPLGGTVGPVAYSPGVSIGFGANILDVPVHVNASVDIAGAHINGTVEVGSLTIGGVRFEDATILLDITPQRFRQTLCGGVHIGTTTLQGLLHVQAGSGGGGPATCGGVTLDPGGGSPGALRARFRLNAASLPIGPVNVQQLTVDAQAELDALAANFNATLNVTAQINALANDLDVDGTIRFGPDGVRELHVKAIGNVTVGGVQIAGDGTCGFPTTTNLPGAPRGSGGRSVAAGGGATSGACVQLDHAPGTSTPFRFGLKGKLTAAGSTASIKGTIDQSQASISGTLNVPTLGNLDVSGTLVFGGGSQIANATGTAVNASAGDWRVSGRFGSNKSLAGGVSARWDFAAGRVSGGLFVRGSASAAIAGANVSLAGTFSSSGNGDLTYSLTGSSSAAVQGVTTNLGLTGAGALNALHDAIRFGVFSFPGLSPIGGRASDERFPERMRGRLHFDASYNVEVTLTQSGLDIEEADIAAKVVYGERFNRDGSGTFGEESASRRNTLVNFDLDAGGIDEFFEMAVADAATRTQAPTFCFEVFGEEFGDC